MTSRSGSRALAAMMVVLLTGMLSNPPVALAIEAPVVDPARVPPDGTPGPEQAMRQSNVCAQPIAIAEPDVALPTPGFAMLNLAEAWQYSTGNGVAVAVIDTGVSPTPRLPVVAGGDYIMGGDGLTDCDAHGTIVASLISAAPAGSPMPAPMPATPAFPPPVGEAVTATDDPAEAEAPQPLPVSSDQQGEQTETAAPPVEPGVSDGLVGVAPHATLISIRQSSRAYQAQNPEPGDIEAHRKAGNVATLARAIVHAAELGAKVINVSVTACVSAADPVDQQEIGAAVWYAATVRDAVVVAAAGNQGEDGCAQNPVFNPLDTSDPRDWAHVKTVSSPSWFSDYVLSVGAVDNSGAPLGESLAGPWVRTAAPGVGIIGLSPQSGLAVNAYPPIRLGEKDIPFWGTSFSAAYVSGTAALVRAKFPQLSAHQVINRILQTAHNPPRGVDNRVGYGVVDPVAALTFDVPNADRQPAAAQTRIVAPPPLSPPPDHRARNIAMTFAVSVAVMVVALALIMRARRTR